MSRVSTPNDPQAELLPETNESFGDLLSQYERTHSHEGDANRQLNGTVIAISVDTVFVDIGYKTEGILPSCHRGQALGFGEGSQPRRVLRAYPHAPRAAQGLGRHGKSLRR